ncbi:MAG TPA: capsule assembly Wzi family protein, partial [Balneolaceae bacterium]|nr:capsule assembly Wzi family protein [Balneolaceae bacterium]
MALNLRKNIIPNKMRLLLLCLIFGVMPLARLAAQPLPVGGAEEQQYRLLQLVSDSTIQTSFLNRPIWLSTYKNIFKNNNFASDSWWSKSMAPDEKTFSIDHYQVHIGPYDPVLKNTFNSKLPYGKNNGAAWYGRGLNTELQGGFYLTSKYFTITFRPHLIYTQNKPFEVPSFIPTYPNGDIRYVQPGYIPNYQLANRIDRPFRFGPKSYGTIDWGESSVRLHYKEFEAGFSKGTLWWGPGVEYALAMSNNAAGLRHLFIGTRKPISLPLNIGKLEFRWIFGWPRDSRYFDLNVYGAKTQQRIQKANILQKTRFINGLNVVYTPSFLPNLSIGVSRIIQQYIPNGGLSVSDLLGVFKSFPHPAKGYYANNNPYDVSYFLNVEPISSYYFRWTLPGADAEFYGELYKGNHNVNLRDFILEPQHGRAYTLGLQKVLTFNGPLQLLKINTEINDLLPGLIDWVRPQDYFYTSHAIKQGYTNRGQILGAAIGPGSKSQYLGFTGYFKHGKLGIFGQREVIDNQFYYERIERYHPGGGFKNQTHHYEKLNVGLKGSYKIGPILLNGKITWDKNYNYGFANMNKRGGYAINGHNIV